MALKVTRSGNAARQAILVLILILVGLGFAYDSLIARPKHARAWAQIKEVDDEGTGSFTSKRIQELISKTPSRVSEKNDAVVETYSWRRGILFNTLDIHVVYTKVGSDLFYYSACTGEEPGEANFPVPNAPMMVNLNPPPLAGAGGGGGGGRGGGRGGRGGGGGSAPTGEPKGDSGAEKSGDGDKDKGAGDKTGDDKSATDNSSGDKTDDKGGDESKKGKKSGTPPDGLTF